MTKVVANEKQYTQNVPDRAIKLFADWIFPLIEKWQEQTLQEAKEYIDAKIENGELLPQSKKELDQLLDKYGIDEKYENYLQTLFKQYIDNQMDMYNKKEISLKELKIRTSWIIGCL